MSNLAAQLQTLADEYARACGGEIEKVLGAGGSAAVYLLRVGETLSALKVYDPSFFDEGNGPAERRRVELQRELQGHTCTSLIGINTVEELHGTCFLQMEYVSWPTLKEHIDQVPEAQVATLIGRLVEAVQFLETKGVVHRDIKPENILVRPDFEALKLIDLGVAREVQGDEDAADATDHSGRRPFIATAQYSSPEYLFRLEAPSPQLWQALTIYQLGGVLHDLIMKRPLFHEAVMTGNKYNVAAAVLKQVPKFKDVAPALLPLAVLASHCLTKDWQLRLRLVDLSTFRRGPTSAAERLRERMTRAATARRSISDLEQLAQQQDLDRQKALEAVGDGVKTRLVELLAKKLPVTVYAESASVLTLSVSLDVKNAVAIRTQVQWDEPSNPLVGKALMRAVLNGDAARHDLRERPVGEMDAANAGLTTFVEAHFEAVCETIVLAQDLSAASTEALVADYDLVKAQYS